MTREEWAGRLKKIEKIWGILCLILAPCVSYVLFEYVTGNLAQIPFSMAALNVAWIFMVYLALFAASGSSRFAVPAGALFFYVLSLAEVFVVAFRGRPVMLWDVLALGTAMTVAGNYHFFVSLPMVLSGFLVLALSAAAFFFPKRIKKLKFRLFFVGGSAAVIAAWCAWFFLRLVPGLGLTINMWEFNDTYNQYGYVLSTAVSCQYLVKKKPDGYTAEKVRQICGEFSEETEPAGSGIQPVNIICIMNESFSELKTAGEFETNKEYFPFMNSLTENTVKGSLCVPVFGSMTSNTEYEFLTGNCMSELPQNCIAYQILVRSGAPSLVSTLKSQGYRTVAMHPYPGSNWNRETVYRNMGFDLFLDEEAYEGCEKLRNYVSDRADYEKLIEMVEEKENPEDRLFLFNVTMQNHGGYEKLYDDFEQEIWLTGELEGKYPKADQYLSLMKKSDEALEYLISYFEESEEPTMIVLFGDHQPSLEDEFFDEIGGKPSSEVLTDERMKWYETPYLIWTNYESEPEETGRLGAIYLSSEVLSRAGLSLTPFNRFLLDMEEELPVVHAFGCFDREGDFYYWHEAMAEGSPYRDELLDYQYLVYNSVYGQSMCREMFFK